MTFLIFLWNLKYGIVLDMARAEQSEQYIPYEATAEAITNADDSPELFLCSMFPDATPEQIILFQVYTKGRLLDGIHYGIDLSEGLYDPVSRVEAYAMGVEEGYKKAQDELGK